ncbi:MAG: permease-like cell division protein FtsX [Clostridiales bacterium]|nr:permease-like cell division protein FtsX [Clostridiales bacterium]
MSGRAFLNSVREGIRGIIRHPLVTIASITTITLMLIIMSVFLIFSVNARGIMAKLSQKPPIEVFMKLRCTEEELNNAAARFAANPAIIEYTVSTPEQNYNSFKANLGDSSSILDDFDYNMYLPFTFSLRLVDPAYADSVCSEVETYDGVSKVQQESRVMQFLTKASKIVNVATIASFAVLLVISLFIISNMVRISVYSRASEIEIMKFVGATNNYIRLPYIIEGAAVGFISALISWGLTMFCYYQIYLRAMSTISTSSFYALVPVSSLMWSELFMLLILGTLIGSLGSDISVRKYVRV